MASAVPTLLLNLGLAALYFVTGRLGLQIAGYADSVTLVWAPAGIALAALVLYGPRLWPGVALGAFGVNILTGVAAPVALGIAAGNTLGALAGLTLFERIGGAATLGRRRDVAGLFAAAAGFPLVSASAGVASLRLGQALTPEHAAGAWLWWGVGDGVGVLLIAPALLTWLSPRPRWLPARRRLEQLALAAVVVATPAAIFFDALPGGGSRYPLSFAVIPPLAWAASRFGPRGAALAAFATAAIAIAGTLARHGPFSGHPLQESLLFLELLVAVVAGMALLLAAEVSRREQSEQRFRLLSENATDLIAEIDARGHVLYVSPSLGAILGRDAPRGEREPRRHRSRAGRARGAAADGAGAAGAEARGPRSVGRRRRPRLQQPAGGNADQRFVRAFPPARRRGGPRGAARPRDGDPARQ